MRAPGFQHRRRRRGLSSLLAMLYLILFATLALGFYASTTTQTQVVANDTNGSRASLAAETGIDFVRFHLMQVSIPAATTEANLMQEVFNDLAPMLHGTGNLVGEDGNARLIQLNTAPNEIQIPAGTNQYIALQNGVGPRFRATITQVGRDLVVRAYGNSGASSTRAGTLGGMQLTFKTEQFPGTLFKNGMASKGRILLDGVRVINGVPASMASVMSTLDAAGAITIGSGNTTNPGGISGTITAIAGRDPVIRTGATVAGVANPTTIHNTLTTFVTPDQAPEIPVADTSIYKPFATTPYVAGSPNGHDGTSPTYDNITLGPSATEIRIDAGTVLRGVIYIKQPAIVKFAGNVKIQGVIVSENPTPALGIPGVTNTLTFEGNGGSKESVKALPNEPKFAGLKALGGGPFIIAPQFQVNMSGNFGSVNGHVVADGISIAGSASATFTGSAIALNPTKTLRVGGAATLTFSEDPSLGFPGLRFREKLHPDLTSYKDFRP